MDGWMDILSFKSLKGETQVNSIMMRNKARMSIISTTVEQCTSHTHCNQGISALDEKSVRNIRIGKRNKIIFLDNISEKPYKIYYKIFFLK